MIVLKDRRDYLPSGAQVWSIADDRMCSGHQHLQSHVMDSGIGTHMHETTSDDIVT